jgi:hypothetical protein
MQPWLDAQKRDKFYPAQVQMTRDLWMSAAKLRKIDNHRQEPWKLPLPRFIEKLYFKHCGKTAPKS